MIKVFCLISPFAFMSLILPSSSWFFKSWLKAFLSLLFLQIFISIILLVIFSINFDFSNIFYQLLYIGSIYSLMRANTYIKEIMGGISTEVQSGISSFKSILKGWQIWKINFSYLCYNRYRPQNSTNFEIANKNLFHSRNKLRFL